MSKVKGYETRDAWCGNRDCFSPGLFYHRGAACSGSRNTSSPPTKCCLHNAYHGCPDPAEIAPKCHRCGRVGADKFDVKVKEVRCKDCGARIPMYVFRAIVPERTGDSDGQMVQQGREG